MDGVLPWEMHSWGSRKRRQRVWWMEQHTGGTPEEQRGVKMWGCLWRDGRDTVWGDIQRGLWPLWPRQVLWSQPQTEWETEAVWKIDVPYLQQLSRGRRGRVGGWDDVRFWKRAHHVVFFFFFFSLSLLLCITSRHFVSGCGPVTCLASCSANMQHSFVALCFFFFHICVCVWFAFKKAILAAVALLILQPSLLPCQIIKTFSLLHTDDALEAWATPLSLARLTCFGTVWPSGALYLPSYLNEVGRRVAPWMSQRNGNRRTLINAT